MIWCPRFFGKTDFGGRSLSGRLEDIQILRYFLYVDVYYRLTLCHNSASAEIVFPLIYLIVLVYDVLDGLLDHRTESQL